MKRFRFSLEAVLKLRSFETQQAMSVHAACVKKRSSLEQTQVEQSIRLESASRQMRTLCSGEMHAGSMLHYTWALQRMKEEMNAQTLKIEAAKATEKEALQVVILAKQKEEALVKLKTKLSQRHAWAYAQAEEKELESLSTRSSHLFEL